MLEDSRARVLVVSEELLPKFAKAIEISKHLDLVIVSGDNAHGHQRFDELLEAAKTDAVTAPTTRDDMGFWLYTSGSTGKPKGAVHSHADLKLTDDLYAAPILGITEKDVCYSVAMAASRSRNNMSLPDSQRCLSRRFRCGWFSLIGCDQEARDLDRVWWLGCC